MKGPDHVSGLLVMSQQVAVQRSTEVCKIPTQGALWFLRSDRRFLYFRPWQEASANSSKPVRLDIMPRLDFPAGGAIAGERPSFPRTAIKL